MSKDKIEVNMNIYDIPILVEQLEKANKEIERLNSIINNDFSKICREKMIDKLSANEMILLQDKEIERLNNIINELEKWLEERIEKHTEDYLDWKYDRNVYLAVDEKLQDVFDKLQELKGSDKE